jgi:hypothetical protein
MSALCNDAEQQCIEAAVMSSNPFRQEYRTLGGVEPYRLQRNLPSDRRYSYVYVRERNY